MRPILAVSIVATLLFAASVVTANNHFIQRACNDPNCGDSCGGGCTCLELEQAACYPQSQGGSATAECDNSLNIIVLKNYFLSPNCTGPYEPMDTTLNTCYQAEGSGYVEYQCPYGKLVKHHRKNQNEEGSLIRLPGERFATKAARHHHEGSSHALLRQRLSRTGRGLGAATVAELTFDHASSRRKRLPQLELRVGARQLLLGSNVFNTTDLRRLAALEGDAPVTIRVADAPHQGRTDANEDVMELVK